MTTSKTSLKAPQNSCDGRAPRRQNMDFVERLTYSRPEDPVVRDARLEQERADADLRRWKDRMLFVVAIVVVLAVGAVCLWILFDPSFSPDDRKWATGLLGLIAGALASHIVGKASK